MATVAEAGGFSRKLAHEGRIAQGRFIVGKR
jgi:hypothetical protein